MRARSPRTPDMNAFRAALRGPGIDTRDWIVYGTTTSPVRATSAGLVVDVELEDGLFETARVGSLYGGAGFGLAPRIPQGTEVKLSAVGGSSAQLVVDCVLWNGDELQAAGASAEDGQSLSNDLVLWVQEGAKLELRTSGAGDINITAAGTGNVNVSSEKTITITGAEKVVVASDAEVLLGSDSATEAFLKGDAFKTWLSATFSCSTPLGPSGPCTTSASVPLSTKVKGE